MYSAVKHQGQPLYKLARAGITVSRRSRIARIYRLNLVAFEPPLVTLEIECGKGTYIRQLAHDLGNLLGCGAHLKGLIRTRYGPFDIKDAISPEQLEDASSNWQHLAYPIDSVLSHWPAVVLSGEQERVVRNGGSVFLRNGDAGVNLENRCRAYSQDGCFLAVLSFHPETGWWQPAKVFACQPVVNEFGS
jgi:tRNA pseudouridine55 synthase